MKRDRRAVLLGGLVISFAWIALRGVPGAVAWLRNEQEAVEQRAQLIARARAEVGTLAALDDSIRSLTAVADALPGLLLVGTDAETAAVDVMRRVRDHLEEEALLFIGFERYAPGDEAGPLVLAGVTVRVETDLAGLLRVLDVMAADLALSVDRVEVEALDPHSEDGLPERLQAGITVSGWYQRVAPRAVPSLAAFRQ